MRLLQEYIQGFSDDPVRVPLGETLEIARRKWDTHGSGNAEAAFQDFVGSYNWLSDREVKENFAITENLSRNLTGTLMQDYLQHLLIQLLEPYPLLDTFTEVAVPFGTYPLWKSGFVETAIPAQRVDLAVGYMIKGGEKLVPVDPWPRRVISKLTKGDLVIPILVVNSKIRISQSEFFDWFGREQLLRRGNPDCLSVQVALRSEMDLHIVEAAQASDKFFLIGRGREGRVIGDDTEVSRFSETVREHLAKHM